MTGLRPTVVFVGPPAAGKSRIARRVAATLNEPYVDTDTVVVSSHGPITDIFSTRGETFFREVEREAVREALGSSGVVALGGGAVMNPDTRFELSTLRVAHITISAEAVEPRLNPEKRPLVKGLASWVALAEARQAWYEEVATRTFDASHRRIEDLAHDVVEWIHEEATL